MKHSNSYGIWRCFAQPETEEDCRSDLMLQEETLQRGFSSRLLPHDARRLGVASLLLSMVAAVCCSSETASAGDLEYRRLHRTPQTCEDCVAVDLSRFPSFTEEALVEREVALELHRSELLSVWASVVEEPVGNQWCAQAVLTDSGRQRASEFARAGPTDPLDDVVVLFVGGRAIDVILRGVLRTGPTLGCFDSLGTLKRALSTLGPIATR